MQPDLTFSREKHGFHGPNCVTWVSVFGSVTPEGDVLFGVIQPDKPLVTRAGTLETTAQGGLMLLRSYEGTTADEGTKGVGKSHQILG